MRKSSHKTVFSLSLSMLLLLLPAAALAEEGRINLHLKEALALPGAMIADEVETATGEATSVDAAPAASLDQDSITRVRDDYVNSEAAVQEGGSSGSKKKGGFGRWLKKRWWVAALVAGAIGVAVSDDGSDGPDDVED